MDILTSEWYQCIYWMYSVKEQKWKLLSCVLDLCLTGLLMGSILCICRQDGQKEPQVSYMFRTCFYLYGLGGYVFVAV